MGVAKMAPITISSNGKELQRIEPENIMNVLVIEDFEDTRENIEQKLKDFGCSVDAVATPKEAAALLEEGKYQLLIADIQFKAPNISGDEFVRKNMDILAKGKRIAYTGFEEEIAPENKSLFHEIIDKGERGEPLDDYIKEIYEERKDLVAKEMAETVSGGNKNASGPDWELAEKRLLESLNQAENKKAQILWYKGRNLSANDLIEEVKDKDSEIGQSHVRMMMNWIKRKKKV